MAYNIPKKTLGSVYTDNAVLTFDGTNKTWDERVMTNGVGIAIAQADTTTTFSVDIASVTTETTVDSANDTVLMYDASATAVRQVTVANIVGAANTIYTADGTLAGARVITQGGNDLTITSTGGNTVFAAATGNITTPGDIAINGGDVTTTATTATLFNTNATTLNVGGAATTINIGTGGAGGGTTTIDHDLVVTGNYTVNGTTTTINSTTLTVDDKNIELGSVTTPTDITADGGGITLKGATDKTFNWVNSTDAWTSSEHIALASGKNIQMTGSTSGLLTIDVPATVTPYTLTLPAADGTSGQVMTTDGSGNLAFTSITTTPAIRTETAAYTVVDADQIILLNADAAVTLPDPSTLTAGSVWTIKLIQGTFTTAAKIDTATAATIDGAAEIVFSSQYEAYCITTDGTNYFIVG